MVNEYYDDVNGEFVYAEDIGKDANYPNQGNNTDGAFQKCFICHQGMNMFV